MVDAVVVLDCYTVEPSGLGVPPYLSTYVRDAYSAVRAAWPRADVRYLTIDDVRWCLNGERAFQQSPLSDPLTYSDTTNRADTIKLLSVSDIVVVIAGDKVPSTHLHAQNGSLAEIGRALSCVRGKRVLLGPLATYVLTDPATYAGLFDAVHTHTMTSTNILTGSGRPATYEALAADRNTYQPLVEQMRWRTIAEIELYRGCTRRRFCSFCNEPVKNPSVVYRDPDDVVREIKLLYAAGLRHFRLGQQTCFFSYRDRNVEVITRLLGAIREQCPELEVLHIDNADPLAVASRSGARIAHAVAQYCTEGNCAPMGIESFDPIVIERNRLTCTPDVLVRAVANINEAGASTRMRGLPLLLPGLNLIYGLPGETHRTHFENLRGLTRLYEEGFFCHRTNIRQVRTFPGTPLAQNTSTEIAPSSEHFAVWKEDITQLYEIPMKQRVYPQDLRLDGLHSFFVSSRGTWYRQLGSYPIQVVEPGTARDLYQSADMCVTEHAGRYIYGARVA